MVLVQSKRQIFSRPIPQNPPLDGPVLLKDGRTAYLRQGSEADLPALQQFLSRVSDHSMAYRFFGKAGRGPEVARRLITPSPGSDEGLSLVVTTGEGEQEQIIGVGSFATIPGQSVAEVAFLVEDQHQGRGIGMLLLERLAIAAEEANLTALEAVVLPENQRMLRIFTDSGYEVRRQFEGGDIMIRFPIEPTLMSVEKAEARDRIATVASLIPFFHPRAIAVVGASRDAEQVGHRVLYNLVRSRFAGPVFPVNPRADVVASIPAYASVLDIPRDVDLAVIAVPPGEVLAVIDDCARKGIHGVIVLTAGFAETGPAGESLQQQLVQKVRANGMRLIGPNCLGVINTDGDVRLHGTFIDVRPLPGRVAMSSQSGALGLAVLEYARELGLGFSSFVGVGNKADVSGNDLLQYWEQDAATDVIMLYLESFGNPRRFANLARRIGPQKPILAVKGGRTSAGQRAAGMHTAATAADDDVVEAFFEQTGVVRCDTLEEMFDIASLLANQPLPRGSHVAILTNAGGPAILCADACEANGLHVPTLTVPDAKALAAVLPEFPVIQNPVDLSAFATPDQYARALRVLLDSDHIDAIIVMFTPMGQADEKAVEQAIREAVGGAQHDKPVLASFMGVRRDHLSLATPTGFIPMYRFPESAARALGRAVAYARWRERPPATFVDYVDINWDEVQQAIAAPLAEEGWLSTAQTEALLKAIGVGVAPAVTVADSAQAQRVADQLGYPVVLKVTVPKQWDKRMLAGVYLNLETADDVKRAFASSRRYRRHDDPEHAPSVVVQPMVAHGIDLFVGVVEQPGFGPVVSVGQVGSYGEVPHVLKHGIMPLTPVDARQLIAGALRPSHHDTAPTYDVGGVEEVLLRLSRLVQEVPGLAQIEIGSLRFYPDTGTCQILDARVRVQP